MSKAIDVTLQWDSTHLRASLNSSIMSSHTNAGSSLHASFNNSNAMTVFYMETALYQIFEKSENLLQGLAIKISTQQNCNKFGNFGNLVGIFSIGIPHDIF